ncbi:MAG: SPFH domain-containing protein [Candidatus Hadarchaeales archaeon]
MPQVIEWTAYQPGKIVWKYPDENITWGAQLIVKEMEAAVFFRDGKAYDVFGPGRHTITTQNLPLLTKVLTRLAGYKETPFKAMVIFVSTKQFDGKFGLRAQTTELAPLMAHGTFWFKIESPQLFVTEVVGGQGAYHTVDVNEFLRGFVNEKVIDELSQYDLATVFTRLDETSMTVKAHLIDAFRRLGIELVDMKFEGIDTEPQYRERLFWIKSGAAAPTEVLRMETVKESAKELGKSPGAGLGAGMMIIPPMFQQPAQPAGAPAAALVICPGCGARIPSSAKFCPECGSQISPRGTMKCPKCGEEIPSTSKFCPACGKSLTGSGGRRVTRQR